MAQKQQSKVQFVCPSCDKIHEVGWLMKGKFIHCPEKGRRVYVPLDAKGVKRSPAMKRKPDLSAKKTVPTPRMSPHVRTRVPPVSYANAGY